MSVGSSGALCQADTLEELLCADGGDFVNVRDPTPCISVLESLLVGRRRGVDRALLRGLQECVYGLNFLRGFTSSGYLDVNAAATSGWAFTYRRILQSLSLLKRPEAVVVGEEALSKLFAGKVHDYSVSSAATGALAPFRKSHVSLPTSAVNAPSLARICGGQALSFLDGFAQRVWL